MRAASHTHQHRSRREAGFSMLEVLVSVLVLSFGLLAVVGLQAAALSGNRDARQQSTAITLARELGEMMRGNKDVALIDPSTGTNPYAGDFSGNALQPSGSPNCLNSGCPYDAASPLTSQQGVANAHMADWLVRVGAALPGARVKVCFDAQPFDANGLPQWNCTNNPSAVLTVKMGWNRASTDKRAASTNASANASARNTAPIDQAARPSVVLPISTGNPT